MFSRSTENNIVMNIKQFGQILRELRLEKELGQVALAKELNYSKAIISEWETGKYKPSSDALIVIAKFFDVTTDYLLGLEDEFGSKIK